MDFLTAQGGPTLNVQLLIIRHNKVTLCCAFSIRGVQLKRKRVGLKTKPGLKSIKSLHAARNRNRNVKIKFEQLITRNIIKIDATRRQILKRECTKIDFVVVDLLMPSTRKVSS